MVFSPQGVESEGYKYHSLHQSGYFIGKLDEDTGVYAHGDFHLLDDGFDFYAPQTMIDKQGRRIMIAWLSMWESEMPEQAGSDPFAGMMTIPRELFFKGEKLCSRPLPELEDLRGKAFHIENHNLSGTSSWQEVRGDCYELELAVDMKRAETFTIALRCDESGDETTLLTFDKKAGLLTLDRNNAGRGPGGVRKKEIKPSGERLDLRIFADRSSVEVFACGGETVMSARIYPEAQSEGIRLSSAGEALIENLSFWPLSSIWSE